MRAATSIRDFIARWNAWIEQSEKLPTVERVAVLRALGEVRYEDGLPPRPIKLGDQVGWGPEGLLVYAEGARIQLVPWSRVDFTRDGRLKRVRRA